MKLRDADKRLNERYAKHMPSAVRLAFLTLGGNDAAEDIAQDAFLRCATRLSIDESDDRFGAYLRTAVTRGALDLMRQRRRQQLRESRSCNGDESINRAEDSVDLEDALWERIRRLPPRQRAVLVLRFWADMSQSSIAATLGIRTGTVKSALARAIESLRESEWSEYGTRNAFKGSPKVRR